MFGSRLNRDGQPKLEQQTAIFAAGVSGLVAFR